MRLLPYESGAPGETSHLSLLIEWGSDTLEDALERVFQGSTEEVEGVVVKGVGVAGVTLMPLRDIDGKGDGAILLVYPERYRQREPRGATPSSAEQSHRAILPRGDDRNLLDATQELVTYLEPDLTIRWANKAAAVCAGIDIEDIPGRKCYEIWHRRDTQCEDCPVVRAIESLSPEHGEITTPDGRRFFIRSYPITDSVGALVGLLEFGQDITQQHRTEEALRRTAGLLESILENSPHPMSVLDTEGNYVMVNRATTELYSLPRETMIGHHLSEFLPEETGSLFDRRVRRLVKERRSVTVEDAVGEGEDAGIFYTTLFPIWDNDGEISAIGGITTDVTDLKAAQELAERADSQKASLLAAVHSKVRDDLAVISSLIDASLRPGMEPETVELVRRTQIQLRALSLLHEQSDATETLGAVDLVVYAQSLVDEVVHSYGCTGSVSLSLWADPMVVPLDFGLSFGLVLTELVANVCRNAFVPRRGGLLEVAISDDTRGVTLRVTDSSRDTQESIEDEEAGGTVVETLVASLRGTVERNPGSFRAWTVLLPLPREDRMGA